MDKNIPYNTPCNITEALGIEYGDVVVLKYLDGTVIEPDTPLIDQRVTLEVKHNGILFRRVIKFRDGWCVSVRRSFLNWARHVAPWITLPLAAVDIADQYGWVYVPSQLDGVLDVSLVVLVAIMTDRLCRYWLTGDISPMPHTQTGLDG